MNDSKQIRDDLAYVASAVRNECPPGVRGIYFLWAVLIPVGFALPDFAPEWAGWYWLVAGFGGGVASWLIGSRASVNVGLRDTRMGWRYGLHWIAAGVAFLLAVLPAWTGVVSMAVVGSNMLLIGGLAYVLAGIHLERPMIYSGVLMFVGYVLLYTAPITHVWTMTGVVIGIALAVSGVMTGRATGEK